MLVVSIRNAMFNRKVLSFSLFLLSVLSDSYSKQPFFATQHIWVAFPNGSTLCFLCDKTAKFLCAYKADILVCRGIIHEYLMCHITIIEFSLY